MIPYLKKINIIVKPQQLEGAALSAKLRQGDFQMYIWCLACGPDPIVSMMRWHSRTPRHIHNYSGYKNIKFDNLLDKASHEMDAAKRVELIRKADMTLMEDAAMWFFAYNGAALAYQPWVHGLQPVAVEMMYQDLVNVWVDDTSPRAHDK
jgi:peptide/nickel transport system substrate-binding protein